MRSFPLSRRLPAYATSAALLLALGACDGRDSTDAAGDAAGSAAATPVEPAPTLAEAHDQGMAMERQAHAEGMAMERETHDRAMQNQTQAAAQSGSMPMQSGGMGHMDMPMGGMPANPPSKPQPAPSQSMPNNSMANQPMPDM